MYSYFVKDENDVRFYAEHLVNRLPESIFDAHVHVNLPEHVAMVSQQTINGDWALECGLIMTYEDVLSYHETLFPSHKMRMLALPWPLPEADIPANNAYLSGLAGEKKLTALMTTRPEWNAEYVEKQLLMGGFAGFKPYPYMAASEKGAEVSVFDFLPHHHLEVANRHSRAVLLHLPRKGRFADDDNIHEIRTIVQKYPDLRLVLAHYGRCFNVKYLREGLAKLGDDKNAVYFDTAAVINPAVHREALQKLRTDQILFGMDLPILLWHGKRRWTETEYFNLCREEFSWNKHPDPEDEKNYTFFVYEQCKAMLDCMEEEGASRQAVCDIFCNNADRVYCQKPGDSMKNGEGDPS
jgi:uncharacterized protein